MKDDRYLSRYGAAGMKIRELRLLHPSRYSAMLDAARALELRGEAVEWERLIELATHGRPRDVVRAVLRVEPVKTVEQRRVEAEEEKRVAAERRAGEPW